MCFNFSLPSITIYADDNGRRNDNNKDYHTKLLQEINHDNYSAYETVAIRPSSIMMSSSPQPSPASEISTSIWPSPAAAPVSVTTPDYTYKPNTKTWLTFTA